MSKRFLVMQAITLVVFGGFGASTLSAIEVKKNTKKNYTKELEEAFAAKLLQEKEEPVVVFKSSKENVQAPGEKEVGLSVINDIKSMLKNQYLDLLASSDLATWADLKSRFDAVKRANELFEVKYSSELKGNAGSAVTTPPPAVPTPTQVSPAVSMPSQDMGMTPSSPEPVVAPAPVSGMPGADMGMAATTPPPAPATTPEPAPMGGMPVMGGMASPDMGMTPPSPEPVAAPAPVSGMPGADMGMAATTPPPASATTPEPAPMGGIPVMGGMASPAMGMTPPTPAPVAAPAPMGGMPMA